MYEQACRTVAEQQCSTVYEKQCSTVTEKQCSLVNEQQCSTVQEQQCSTVQEEVCHTVNEHQCHTVTEEQCSTEHSTEYERVCRSVPGKECAGCRVVYHTLCRRGYHHRLHRRQASNGREGRTYGGSHQGKQQND